MTTEEWEDYLASMYEKMCQRQPALMSELAFEIRIHPEVAKAIGWTNGQLLTKYQLPLVLDDLVTNKDGRSDIYILDPKYLTGD